MSQPQVQMIARRTAALYAVVILVGAVIVGRLFQLQVLRHDFYSDLALAEHEAKFTIPASRGTVYVHDGANGTVPVVLNEVLPTVYLDPFGIEDEDNDRIAEALATTLSIDKADILNLLDQNESRYQVVKKQVDQKVITELRELDLSGVGFVDESYRVYPQGNFGAQILGFVNGAGEGQYGIEEFLDQDLSGADGRFEAVTDVHGIPLATSEQNVIVAPEDGSDVTLTIDVNIQQFVEEALKKGVRSSKGQSGSAIVIDPRTGAVLAMANYPSYDPDEFGSQEDFSVFLNDVISSPYETGSGVKVLTMAAALNEGVVTKNTTFNDTGFVQVEDRRIKNAGGGGGVRTMTDVITHSVNTGAVYALEQLGGGEINKNARSTLYDYFHNKYGFGNATGLAQANEAAGLIYGPNEPEGNNVRYANMTFGQGMTVTMMQMAAAVSSIVNGGDYYQPYLVSSVEHSDGSVVASQPNAIRSSIISREASKAIREMMQTVVSNGGGLVAQRKGYTIGGKTGTAQVLDEETGEYSNTREIGSFVGFGGTTTPEYVIMTRVDEPQIPGYAGTVAAAPIFADISNFMIDYYQLPPK